MPRLLALVLALLSLANALPTHRPPTLDLSADEQALILDYTRGVVDEDFSSRSSTPPSDTTPLQEDAEGGEEGIVEGEEEEDEEPVTPRRDPLADHDYESETETFYRAREIARLNIMDRILIALGPPFGEKLPKAPTNDTLATVPTPIDINSGTFPCKYKRCSSQTYFPSCEVPRNTDPEIWPQRFNLFFNLSREFNHKVDVMNATLRLYKNNSLPLEVPKTLLIEVFVYIKRLTRKRHRTRLVVDTQISSDYIGWVTLPVETMVRRWRRRKNNHGLLVTVNDVDGTPWDAPRIFVPMDCDSGNNSLLPLPFEVQTEGEKQRYPALNIRLGSPEDDPIAAASTTIPPEDITIENVTQIQSDEPALYDYDDYRVQFNTRGLSHTSETSEGYVPVMLADHVPNTPENLFYHHTQPVHDEANPAHPASGEVDPYLLTLSTHHPHRAHSNHEGDAAPAALPVLHAVDPTYPTHYLGSVVHDDYEDDLEPETHHSVLPAPTSMASVPYHPAHGRSQWMDDPGMLVSEREWAAEQGQGPEHQSSEQLMSDNERVLGGEREWRSPRRHITERRSSAEHDGQTRKSRRERQGGNNERRQRRRNRGKPRRG